jgi:hypothetical protein
MVYYASDDGVYQEACQTPYIKIVGYQHTAYTHKRTDMHYLVQKLEETGKSTFCKIHKKMDFPRRRRRSQESRLDAASLQMKLFQTVIQLLPNRNPTYCDTEPHIYDVSTQIITNTSSPSIQYGCFHCHETPMSNHTAVVMHQVSVSLSLYSSSTVSNGSSNSK